MQVSKINLKSNQNSNSKAPNFRGNLFLKDISHWDQYAYTINGTDYSYVYIPSLKEKSSEILKAVRAHYKNLTANKAALPDSRINAPEHPDDIEAVNVHISVDDVSDSMKAKLKKLETLFKTDWATPKSSKSAAKKAK